MSLYSLHHSSVAMGQPDAIGKAAARVRYITRVSAATSVLEARTGLCSLNRSAVRAYCAERERLAGRNGRVVETIMVALPREADHEQRLAMLRALAEHITKGEAPYIGAIHDAGKDAANPHAHLLAFEALKQRRPGQRGRTGKVIRLSEDGALDRLRADWAEIHNRMMAEWGIAAPAIDHRSHAARGIASLPTIHEGPAARAMTAKGTAPLSTEKSDRRGRVIPWPEIDEGTTRADTNQLVRTLNAAMAAKEQSHHGRADRFPCPASSDHARPTATDSGSLGPHQRAFQADGRGAGSHQRVGRADGRQALGPGPALSPRAAGRCSSPPPSLADDGSIDRGGWRYRPSRLRALIARLAVASRSLAAMVRAVDWRRLTPRPVPYSWGKPRPVRRHCAVQRAPPQR